MELSEDIWPIIKRGSITTPVIFVPMLMAIIMTVIFAAGNRTMTVVGVFVVVTVVMAVVMTVVDVYFHVSVLVVVVFVVFALLVFSFPF